jgi:hypothetical protein
LGLAACGAPVEDGGFESEDVSEAEEDLGTLAQALSPSCGTATPHFTYTDAIYPTALVTNGGAGCTKIVDINSIDLVDFLPPVLTANSAPTNQADCLNTRVVEYLWDKTDPGDPVYLGSLSQYGVWDSFLGCDLAASPPAALVSGRSYRFGVSAQRPKYTYIDLKFRSIYFH